MSGIPLSDISPEHLNKILKDAKKEYEERLASNGASLGDEEQQLLKMLCVSLAAMEPLKFD